MNLFISWSGEFSKRVAECLKVWIPTIIQTVEVFCSSEDIAKGENWNNRLSKELEQSNFGIVCLTPENVQAPWIHFEAGALSKVSGSRVSAIMLGINPSDVKGPLARFQNTAFNREEFYHLFQSINDSHENPLKQAILDHAFDNSWEKLEHDIAVIVKDFSSHSPAPASEKSRHDELSSNNDALQEILSIVRTLSNNQRTFSQVSSVPSNNDFETTLLELNNENAPTLIAFISCPRAFIDDVIPIMYKYSYHEPESIERWKGTLSIGGKCVVWVERNQILAFVTELQKFSATVSF